MDRTKELLKDNKKVLIFSEFTGFLKVLKDDFEEEGIQVGEIYGGRSHKQREKDIEKFKNGELNVLLLNIKSAGRGLTLNMATESIFSDLSWSPSANNQAFARIRNTGTNDEDKHIRILKVKDSIDEVVLETNSKKEQASQLVN